MSLNLDPRRHDPPGYDDLPAVGTGAVLALLAILVAVAAGVVVGAFALVHYAVGG